jgi:hypothetical protein
LVTKGISWETDVDEMVSIFRQGLISLIPVFDKARITWKGDSTYDDFERIAEALYDSIVRDSMANASSLQSALQLARYGVTQPGRELSRILVNDPADRLALHELDTRLEPFDTIVCLRVDDGGRDLTDCITEIAFDGAHFLYEARYGSTRVPSHHHQVEVML